MYPWLLKAAVNRSSATFCERDCLALALAHGPVRVDCRIKVEDSTSGEGTDGDGNVGEEQEERLGGKEVQTIAVASFFQNSI